MSIHGFMAIHFLARDMIRMAIRWTPVDLDTREGGWIHGKERGGEMGRTQQKGYERAIRSHDARLHHQGLVSLRRVYSKRITRPPWFKQRPTGVDDGFDERDEVWRTAGFKMAKLSSLFGAKLAYLLILTGRKAKTLQIRIFHLWSYENLRTYGFVGSI